MVEGFEDPIKFDVINCLFWRCGMNRLTEHVRCSQLVSSPNDSKVELSLPRLLGVCMECFAPLIRS